MKKSVKSLLLATSALLMPLSGQAQDCCFDDQEAPSFDSSDCCSGKFSAEVDFLWWEIRHDEHIGTVVSGTETDVHYSRLNPKNKYHPGFRLGFNWEGCCNCWDLGVFWTHYNANSNRGINADGSGEIFINGLGDGIFDGQEFTLFSGSNHLKSTLDYVDIDFSRDITCNSCFTFTPHVGVRGLWLEEKYRTSGAGFNDESVESLFRARGKHHSTGYGLEGGFWASWNVGCNLAVYGHVGGALLAFERKFKGSELVLSSTTEDVILSTRFREKHRSTSPMFNYTLGLQYLWKVCDYDLLLKAAWEQVHLDRPHHQWQGLTAGVEFKF
jgi:hypothetical protein